MSAVDTIRRVLKTNVLLQGLVAVPEKGASEAEISGEEARLARPLSAQHRAVLQEWNGLNLDVIRFYGCGENVGKGMRLVNHQEGVGLLVEGGICVGSDPSGFAYIEDAVGQIYSYDHDGGELKLEIQNLDDFVDRYVFGRGAASFGGEEWLEELRAAGLIE